MKTAGAFGGRIRQALIFRSIFEGALIELDRYLGKRSKIRLQRV